MKHDSHRFLQWALSMTTALIIACGPPQAHKPARGPGTIIRFQSSQPDAEVWINETPYPSALRRGVELPPGQYRIEIRKSGYFTHYELMNVSGGTKTLQVELAPRLSH